jgi:hypothetical protein
MVQILVLNTIKTVSVLREQLHSRRIFEEIIDFSEGRVVAIFIDLSRAFDSVKWT